MSLGLLCTVRGELRCPHAASARCLLDALRYLWRGTRWRTGQERIVPADIAGYLIEADGTQRSIGEFGSELGRVAQESELDDTELLVLTEFFGLNGFPAGLSTGRDALVGMVAMPSSPKPAGRSTVAKLLDRAVAKFAMTLAPRPFPRDVILRPEPDPATRRWVLAPPALGRQLRASELADLLEAALYAAFDLIERSEMFGQVNAALHEWGQKHLGLNQPIGPIPKLRPEHRHAANAVLAVTLWEIAHSKPQVNRALAGEPILGWVGVPRISTGGRLAIHPKYGPMMSGLDADELVLLTGEVMEGRDSTGRAADLVMDEVLAGRHRQLFDADTRNTVLRALGRGLAAAGSWRTIELARWYGEYEPLSLTTVSLVAWSAHVASLHRHDTLAWRLTSLAERLAGVLHKQGQASPRHLAQVTYQVELIRSGCRVREADRWRGAENVRQATRGVIEATQRLQLTQTAAGQLGQHGHLSRSITIQLRLIEILLVTARLRDSGHPVDGFENERSNALRLAREIDRRLSSSPADIDDDDFAILRRRLDLLLAALHADAHLDVDDSPPGA